MGAVILPIRVLKVFIKKSLKTAINGKDFTEESQSKFGHKKCVRLIFQIPHLVQIICSVNCSVV